MTQSKHLQRVTAEQGYRLRAAGFNWDVDYYLEEATGFRLRSHQSQNFNNDWVQHKGKVSIPTVALALKYMRDVKGIDWQIVWAEIEGVAYAGEIKPLGAEGMVIRVCLESTYESVEIVLLDTLLTLIEK